jgi:hypothetical protein
MTAQAASTTVRSDGAEARSVASQNRPRNNGGMAKANWWKRTRSSGRIHVVTLAGNAPTPVVVASQR